MIKRGEDASIATGISLLHAKVFQATANTTGDVIACRAVGIYATGLIEESYSTKGFHNKAKSCDWGPMAGFVLVDPRFSKSEKIEEQEADVKKAINYGALAVPLFISKKRRSWLMEKCLFRPSYVQAPNVYIGLCHKGELSLQFRLKLRSDDLYSVSFCKATEKDLSEEKWSPVLALRDPHCTISQHSHLSATTGDYDLFAVWTRKVSYLPASYDKRMVSHALLEKNISAHAVVSGEHEHLGNLTPRIAVARFELNEGFRRAGYTGGDLVHHSDEGGRPFVQNIDLPIFAVVPGKTEAYCLESATDLSEFIHTEMGRDYVAILSPGWMKQLLVEDLKRHFAK